MTIEPASDPPALPIADQDTLMGMVVMVPKDHFVDPLVYELRDEIIPESISRHGRR